MGRQNNIRLTRRDMLKLGAGGAGMFMISAGGLAIPKGFAGGGGGGGGALYIEAFPTSPLILKPFSDALVIPPALRPMDPTTWDSTGGTAGPEATRTASGQRARTDDYYNKYGQTLGEHQLVAGRRPDGLVAVSPCNWLSTTAARLPDQGAGRRAHVHDVEGAADQQLRQERDAAEAARTANATAHLAGQHDLRLQRDLPGPAHQRGVRARLARALREPPRDKRRTGTTAQDFGAPNYSFLTHLHNGHTAPESDGQPHYSYHRFASATTASRTTAAWEPGEWVDQMYLGYPAGGDEREKQSFFWFHDHVHGHTGANVYKGMVGLMPLYDPMMDNGDERTGYRLPGVRTDYGDGLVRRRLRHPAGALRLPAG